MPSFSGSVVLPTELAHASKSIEIPKSSQNWKIKTAGRLKKFTKNWERLTKDNFILECVSSYEIPVLDTFKQWDPTLEPVWSKDTQRVPKTTEIFGYKLRYTLYYLWNLLFIQNRFH